MLSHIKKLYELSTKEERTIIGLMSGTSLDGLDIALCKFKGSGRGTKVEVDAFETVPYDNEFREEIKKIFSIKEGNIELLVLLHSYIGKKHGKMVLDTLAKWKIQANTIDAIASHGQTIYHAPKSLHKHELYENSTLQIGDGDHIAVVTNIITIADFRMKHIAAGGEGAPLAVYGDYLIFSHQVENRIMLNLGGIANFTWLPNASNELLSPCFSTDVGPGNTMMDAYIQKYKEGYYFDKDAMFGYKGKVNESLLNALCDNDFFSLDVPKTIGPELFNLTYLEIALGKIIDRVDQDDVIATLNRFSSEMIAQAINRYTPKDSIYTIYASGGGASNPLLMANLKNSLPKIQIKDISSIGINPDAKEAVLFALLANECLAGNGMDMKQRLNGVPNVSMGKICLPE